MMNQHSAHRLAHFHYFEVLKSEPIRRSGLVLVVASVFWIHSYFMGAFALLLPFYLKLLIVCFVCHEFMFGFLFDVRSFNELAPILYFLRSEAFSHSVSSAAL